jgi:hypothetical protein
MNMLLLLLVGLLSVLIWQLHRIGWVIWLMYLEQLDVNNRARIEARTDVSAEYRAKAHAEWETHHVRGIHSGP